MKYTKFLLAVAVLASWAAGQLLEYVPRWSEWSFLLEAGSIDTSGDIWGLSKQNYANLSKGYTDAGARSDKPPTIDYFGYRPQGQYPAGQIGDGNGLGVGDWRFPLAGTDPADPMHPVPPPQTDSTPMPRLVRMNGGKSPAAPIAPAGDRLPFSERLGNWIASPEDGIVPRYPNLPVPSPEPGRSVGIFTGKPMPWWTLPPPLGGLLGESTTFARGSRSSPAGSAGDAPSSPPPAPRKSEGAVLPYVLEYLQYLKQLDGG